MSAQAGTVLGFVGVSTAGSSIQRVFPAWARELGAPHLRLVGHDLPLGAGRESYRDVVRGIRDDPAHAGALVTSHKLGVYRAAGDMFDSVDRFAELCGEVSSVSKRGGALVGRAKDPLTAGLAAAEFLPEGHFGRTGGHALVLGSGGAGTAIAWYLANRADPPERIVCTGLRAAEVDHVRSVLADGGAGTGRLETAVAGDSSDALLEDLPPHSLVVNATGMGKDLPGSPLTDTARFPEAALAWELNYRGELRFLHQAREAGVRAVDGWRYFIHGWTQVIAEVFGLRLSGDDVERLAAAAGSLR